MISVQREDFDAGAEYRRLRELASDAGAIVTFAGLVREMQQPRKAEPHTSEAKRVRRLFLEHYPGMTEARVEKIVDEARERWGLLAVRVIHRVGELHPGEQIVWVGAAASHRQDAFDGARFIMDYLKTQAPFWKKQHIGKASTWVRSTDADHEAARRWRKS